MDFLQQIIRLLSEPPGSVIYHLVTLFALQAVFALSYARWRRSPDDGQAQRMAGAAAAIFLGRLLLLFAALFYGRDPQQAATFLPPLEQAMNTATVALMAWSLAPRPARLPHLLDIMLVMVLVLTGVMYLFFAQDWKSQVEIGITYYGGTPQAIVWTLLQFAILAAALTYILLKSRLREPLPVIIIGLLLVAQLVHLWNYSEFIPTDTNIPYWVRLSYLIVFPLWAGHAYQRTLTPLLASEETQKRSILRFGSSLQEAAQVIATRQPDRRTAKSLEMASHLLDAAFVAVGLVDRRNTRLAHFTSNLPGSGASEPQKWTLNLSEHPSLSAAFANEQTMELLPSGLGARQLHQFYRAVGVNPLGPLLVHPLVANDKHIGLLVVAAAAEMETWSDYHRSLIPGLSSYIAQALFNSQTPPVRFRAVPPPPVPRVSSESIPTAILLNQVQLQNLESERDELKTALEEAVENRKLAEAKVQAQQKQARYLAAALRAAQKSLEKPDEANQAQLDTLITGTEDPTQISDRTEP